MYIKLSEELKNKVWEKGEPISNENPDKYRQDKYGNWIAKKDFEKSKSLLGWKISKIDPSSSPKIENLEPLFWKNAQSL